MKTTLTDSEWDELINLKDAISFNPFSVTPEKQELFTELFVKSLSGKGEYTSISAPTNY
jgi:hypothetical protein